MKTEDLIRKLVQDGNAVRRLRNPWVRAGLWLAISLPYIAVVMLAHPLPEQVWSGVVERRFLLEQSATILTAVTAAVAAFSSTIPGYDRRVLLLPIVPMAVWLGSVGFGCIQDWLKLGAEGLTLDPDWSCLLPAVLIGIVPIMAMLVMLRRGAPLSPRMTLVMAAIAVAALGNVGLRLFHVGDPSVMILVWHVGIAAVLVGIAGLLGRQVLGWRSTLGRPRLGV